MNKSIKFLAISLLMVTTVARAADVWSGAQSGLTQFASGFATAAPFGAAASAAETAAARIKDANAKKAALTLVYLGGAKGLQCTHDLLDKKNWAPAPTTNFQRCARFGGDLTGWAAGNIGLTYALTFFFKGAAK